MLRHPSRSHSIFLLLQKHPGLTDDGGRVSDICALSLSVCGTCRQSGLQNCVFAVQYLISEPKRRFQPPSAPRHGSVSCGAMRSALDSCCCCCGGGGFPIRLLSRASTSAHTSLPLPYVFVPLPLGRWPNADGGGNGKQWEFSRPSLHYYELMWRFFRMQKLHLD